MGKFPPRGAIIFRMKSFRAISFRAIVSVAALVVFCAAGTVRAADESSSSADSVRAAQAQGAANVGDNRPATLGDLRHVQNRMDAQISELRAEFRAEMRALREDMNQMLYTLLAAMIALFGLTHLPTRWRQLRENGKAAAASGIFLVVLAIAGAGAAIAAPL